MRILVYEWKAYNYRDILFHMEQLGHVLLKAEGVLEHYDDDPIFAEKLRQTIRTEKPDFIFTVNYFAQISEVCMESELPYVVWTCDCPLISMHHRSVFYPCNYIFLFDRADYLEWQEMGVRNCWYLPLAVDADRMADTITRASDLAAYRSDIAFVGSLYERNTYDEIRPSLPDYLRGYFDAVIEAQKNVSGGNLIERLLTPDVLAELQAYFHLEKSVDSFSDIGLIFATTVLGFKTAEVIRREALMELSRKYQVTVYSNSNVSDLLRVRYGGGLDYWGEMPKAFAASRINLNFTIPNIKSGLPLRIWDILGAGGFLMTNYQAELPMYFENRKDYVCFEDVKELTELAGYYLEHEEERSQIALNGKRKAVEAGNYQDRIHKMLEIVSNRGSSQS